MKTGSFPRLKKRPRGAAGAHGGLRVDLARPVLLGRLRPLGLGCQRAGVTGARRPSCPRRAARTRRAVPAGTAGCRADPHVIQLQALDASDLVKRGTSGLWNFHCNLFPEKINNVASLIYFMKMKSS